MRNKMRDIEARLRRIERGLPPLPQEIRFISHRGKLRVLSYDDLIYRLRYQLCFIRYYAYEEDKTGENDDKRRPMGTIYFDDYELCRIIEKMPILPPRRRLDGKRETYFELWTLLRYALLGFVRTGKNTVHHLYGATITFDDEAVLDALFLDFEHEKHCIRERMKIWEQLRREKHDPPPKEEIDIRVNANGDLVIHNKYERNYENE
jgi:hypothetical protein